MPDKPANTFPGGIKPPLRPLIFRVPLPAYLRSGADFHRHARLAPRKAGKLGLCV